MDVLISINLQITATFTAMSSPDWTPSQAKERANRFVREWLNAARYRDRGHSAEAECTPWGRHDLALRCYGFALHTLQDSTSPAHKGFSVLGRCVGPPRSSYLSSHRPRAPVGPERSRAFGLLNITWYSYAYYFKSRFELPTDSSQVSRPGSGIIGIRSSAASVLGHRRLIA